MSAKRIRLTVADAHGRHDLIVAADSTVSELLTVGGVDLRRYVGTTTSGAAIDLDSEVSVTPGDGGVIWLFDRTQAGAAPEAKAAAATTPFARSRRNAVLLAMMVVITATLVGTAVIAPTPLTLSVTAAVLLVGAVALLTRPVNDDTIYVAFFAPLLGCAAGAVALAGFH